MEKESYLHVLSRYIHLNPVRIIQKEKTSLWEKKKYLKNYKWSSLIITLEGGKSINKIVMGIVVIVLLQGCAGNTDMQKKAKDQPLKLDVGKRMPFVPGRKDQPLKLDVGKRMLLVPGKADKKEPEPLYKFRTKGMPIVTALNLFARSYDLNIMASPDVTGAITVDFKDLSFEKSMEVILDAYGYYWSREGSLIRVYKYETKIFAVDYLRLTREGTGSSLASIASSGGGESGKITIKQSDTIKFWDELEKQLKAIISDDGKIIINRMSGTIQVTDFHKRVIQVENFLNSVTKSIKRQVQINVKILDVLLNDEFSLGINWNLVARKLSLINTAAFTSIITAPIGGATPKAKTISLDIGLFGGDTATVNAIVEALKEQGDLKIVSRPSIRVMNNQPALIKVGTDRPFFNQTTTLGTGVNPNTTTEEVLFITEGLVLSITPQISGDGLIILDVTPIISRLVGTATSSLGSTAPVMEVKQSSTVVQLRDGEMVTVGGLIQDENVRSMRKTPILGDLPVVGNMFKSSFKSKKKSELVIFITPKIINNL